MQDNKYSVGRQDAKLEECCTLAGCSVMDLELDSFFCQTMRQHAWPHPQKDKCDLELLALIGRLCQAADLRGRVRMMSASGGLKPRAVAGSPSVTKLTHSSCTGLSTSGMPAQMQFPDHQDAAFGLSTFGKQW